MLRNDDEEKRNVLLHKIEFITENSGFGISDKYGITKPLEEREEKVRQGGGVRLLPGRNLSLDVSRNLKKCWFECEHIRGFHLLRPYGRRCKLKSGY